MTLYFIKDNHHRIKVVCFSRAVAVDELYIVRCNECSQFHYIDELNIFKWIFNKL